ncbi:MAG: type II toxin-antitoxin system RelE/ParE family toxin [Firmicutes bacterium]|nr:type II toxin-antitoxin system RelE/ParE family toxin [Bacillota bacterium]
METKFEVIMTDECDNELDKICNYIRQDLFANMACNSMLEEIMNTIDILEHSPFIYPKVIRYKPLDKEYRKFTIKHYVIIYDVDEKENIVYLDHIYYGGSDYINRI